MKENNQGPAANACTLLQGRHHNMFSARDGDRRFIFHTFAGRNDQSSVRNVHHNQGKLLDALAYS